MTEGELEDLLFTLDVCAEALPFDLHQAHVQRLQKIKTILEERHSEEKERPREGPPKLSLVVRPFEPRPR